MSLLLICGCGEKEQKEQNGDNNSQGNKQNSEAEDERISGRIITTAYNSSGFSSFTIVSDDGSVYAVSAPSQPEYSLRPGEKVVVTVDGDILESDPMQAVAKGVEVTEEFSLTPEDISVYSVYGISASKLSGSLTSTGQMFGKFVSYDECMNYLKSNELEDSFAAAVGNTDITTLTDTFFKTNDLCMFVVNSAEDKSNKVKNVYISDGMLYLLIEQTTTDAVLSNMKYDIFLMAVPKGSGVKNGMALTVRYLEPSI